MEKHWIVWVVYFAFLVHNAIQRSPVPCDHDTCHQFGTCTLDKNRCSCIKGFEGRNCTDDLDECLSGHRDPCGHRGICNNTSGSFECQCLGGWTGARCDNQLSETFNCTPHYYGDKCSNTTCVHGYPNPELSTETTVTTVTSSILNSVVCTCDEGWTKNRSDSPCDVDVNECMKTPSPCLHGGTCNNTIGSYHCECTALWEGINCSDYVTTTTEVITLPQTAVNLTNETITARQLTSTVICATDPKDHDTTEPTVQTITEHEQLESTRAISTEQAKINLTQQTTEVATTETPQNIIELITTVLYVKDPKDHHTTEPTVQTITEDEQLKSTRAISTVEATINLTQQTTNVAKTETPQEITKLATTALYVTGPTNQTTVEHTEETSTDHPQTSATDLLSTQTGGEKNTTADYSSSVTDSASTEAQRRPFLSNRTLELATGPSLTRLPSDSENEQKDKLKVWMIALIAVVVVLACVLIAALLVLKYYTVANKTICKRMTNRVDVSLASMENNWNFKANKRMQRGSISGV